MTGVLSMGTTTMGVKLDDATRELAGCVVKLNTHGGGAHAQNSCHLSLGLCGCMEISTMLQLCATLLIVACDGSREKANTL